MDYWLKFIGEGNTGTFVARKGAMYVGFLALPKEGAEQSIVVSPRYSREDIIGKLCEAAGIRELVGQQQESEKKERLIRLTKILFKYKINHCFGRVLGLRARIPNAL